MDFDDFNDDIHAGAAAGMQDEEGAGEQMEPLEQQKPKPKRVIKKRAKLTLEQLQAPNGLPEVFEKFPKWFQEGYKGKGHEVRDLRRLLELYQRWHPRLFNYCDYNQFESSLEKMSGTNALKVKLQDMRAKLPDFVDPRPPEQEQEHADGDVQQQQQADQHQQQQQAGTSQLPQQQQQAGGFDDIDDDELLELQQAPMDIQLMDELMDEWEPPAAAPQPAAPPAPAASSQPAEQQHSGGAAMPSPASGAQDAPRIAPKRNVRDWSDDDDDDLLGLPSKQPKRQPAQQRGAQPGSNSAGSSGAPPATASGLEDDDDDAGLAASSPPAAAGPQPVRGRLRQRQLLDESDGEEEGTAAAAATAAELEDVEDNSPPVQLQETVVETEAGVRVELLAKPMDEGVDDGAAGDEGQPGLKLQVGTEYEGSARRTFLIDDDDDD